MRSDKRPVTLEEAELFSEKMIADIKNIFCDIFSIDEAVLYSWGSLARREMCIFSDIDIIILQKKPSLIKIDRFKKLLSINFPYNKIDLIQKYSEIDLIRIAKIDGGDRQAVTLARFEIGIRGLENKFRRAIRKNLTEEKDIIKELLYTIVNLIKVYPKLFSKYDLKFCQYGTRYINFAFLYAKYIYEKDIFIYDTKSALKVLLGEKVISDKIYQCSLLALSDFIRLRNRVQMVTKKECNIWSDSCLPSKPDVEKGKMSIELLLKKHKKNIKLLVEALFAHSIKDIVSKFQGQNRRLVYDLFFNYSGKLDEKLLLVKSDSDIMLMLLAYCTNDPLLLDHLYETNKEDWYIAFGIANNMHTNPLTLDKLVNPIGKSEKIAKLYNDFAWRNIYLYVARNTATSEKTLRYIINKKGSREMDINAAKQNISIRTI
jgi:predicted nucleotidyltransferase